MPRRPSTPCKQNGCPNLVPYGHKYCDNHKANYQLDTKSTKAKGYNAQWNKARLRYLKVQPHPTEVTKTSFGIKPTGKHFVSLVMIGRPRRLTDMWSIRIDFSLGVSLQKYLIFNPLGEGG